jgi:hypothetical protein
MATSKARTPTAGLPEPPEYLRRVLADLEAYSARIGDPDAQLRVAKRRLAKEYQHAARQLAEARAPATVPLAPEPAPVAEGTAPAPGMPARPKASPYAVADDVLAPRILREHGLTPEAAREQAAQLRPALYAWAQTWTFNADNRDLLRWRSGRMGTGKTAADRMFRALMRVLGLEK